MKGIAMIRVICPDHTPMQFLKTGASVQTLGGRKRREEIKVGDEIKPVYRGRHEPRLLSPEGVHKP
jgi:hypothetical protein